MITRAQILPLMPAPKYKDKTEYQVNINKNIINTIHKDMPAALAITKNMASVFRGATTEETTRNVWQFLRTQIKYVKDGDNQDIKLPNRFVADGTGDCKSFSLFAASVLQNLGIKTAFRYASYSADPTPQHVYCLALTDKTIGGKSEAVIVDGVWPRFNSQKKFTFKKDFMAIRTLSGFDSEIGKTKVGKFLSKVQDKAKGTAIVKQGAKLQTKAKGTAVVKAAAKAQGAVKKAGADAQNTIKAKAKEANKNVVRIARKGADALKNVADNRKKIVNAPSRRAFRTLVAANFHGYANKLKADSSKAFDIWKKLGGDTSELQKSIEAGSRRKKILGIGCMQCQISYPNQIGAVGVATIAALLAAAAPIIIALVGILKENKNTLDAAANAGGDQKIPDDPDGTGSGNDGAGGGGYPNTGGGGGYYTEPTQDYTSNYEGDQAATETAKPTNDSGSSSNTGGLLLAALAAKLLFF